MATVVIGEDEAAGRAAADRLANDWDNRDWVPIAPTAAWARAATGRLGEIMAEQPSMLRASRKGAEKGASTLSPRPFQGLVECLQNADDLGANCLHVAYREGPRSELLIVHDGSAVTLANVAAMLLPWLSTKENDPDAAGRFGIGQQTLSSLGKPIALHAPPFHFVMGADGPEPTDPEPDINGVYDSAGGKTMLVIPLEPTVTCDSIIEAIRDLDADALIFLKSICRLHFHHLDDSTRDIALAIEVKPVGRTTVKFSDEEALIEIADVNIVEPIDVQATKRYRRYSTRRAVKPGEKRSNKATGATTPMAICVPIGGIRPLRIYDRMPLPITTGLTIGLDAQFDPDSARSTLQPNKWNRNRFADLGQLVAWAAVEAFGADTTTAWNHVPLNAEVNQGQDWIAAQVRELVTQPCHAVLRSRLKVRTPSGATALSDLVYEVGELESILTEDDVKRLRPDNVALPRAGRDPSGRWRRVLEELGESDVVPILDALEVLDGDPRRGAAWYVSFATLAERHGLFHQFVTRLSLLLADGSVIPRPSAADVWVLVKNSQPDALATRLGLARKLHPAYLAPDAPTSGVISKLEEAGVLFDDRNAAADVLAILGRGSATSDGAMSAVRLLDADLLALREAWAALPRELHPELGQKVSRRVELKATWYEADGKRGAGWARPVDMYLPATIDREVDSFAKAAARAPGLKWADAEYGILLKQKAGRSAIGAQRLLSAWGVAREPRLIRPTDEVAPWARDRTPASPIHTQMRTEDQLDSIRASGTSTHLIDDHWSPDAYAVAADIAKAPVKTRRKRAMAFLSVLSRAWERRYAEAATAYPAYAYNGYWNRRPEVRATWLARLADLKWMPDAGNGLQRPADLQLQVSANPLRPSERSSTVAKLDTQVQRSGVLAALGVKAGPTQRDLIERLRGLRKQPVTDKVSNEVTATYQLLAASLRDNRDGVIEGRMTPAQLRNAFRAGPDGPGLLLGGGGWLSPESVLRGPAIFGARRNFAPHVEGLEPLWKMLDIRAPTAGDAISVLRELAASPPSPTDLGIAIRALTLVAGEIGEMSSQLRTTLRRLPLWTGTEWTTKRPVYALEGEALLAGAPATMRVWRAGLSSFSMLDPLLEPLGVVRLTPLDFRAVSTPAYGFAEGETIRPTFTRAVALLRQEMARADQSLLDGLTVEWDEVLAAPVVIDPELSIVADLPSGPVIIPANAHVGREPLCLIVRSTTDAGTAEGAGTAVASLFNGDRQKAAWAWAAVWPRAAAGEQAAGVSLPKMRAEQGDAKDRLDRLAQQAAQRTGKGRAQSARAEQKISSRKPPVRVRKLRELDELEPSVGVIVNEGSKPAGSLVFTKRRKGKERRFNVEGEIDAGTDQTKLRTVLPPSSDRERMALEAVRRALRLDVQQFNDLRNTRGVGVDAVDDLRQCYEIKMSSGTTIPTEITLTASEVEAAQNDPDFFLAVVCGLEEGAGQLRVRFIFDPLTNLDVRVRSDLTLTGVDKAQSLEFSFDRRKNDG